MMLRIQKYDVEIKYVPGKEIPLADALSRVSPCPGDTIEGLNVSVHELHLHLNASPTRIDQIKEETSKDEVLGGDHLTVERATSAVNAVANSDKAHERLEEIILKYRELHCEMIFLISISIHITFL